MLVTLTSDGWLGLTYLFLLWLVARLTRQETSALLAGLIAVSVTNHASSLAVVVVLALGTYLMKVWRP